MVTASSVGSEVLGLIKEAGRPVRIRIYAESGASAGYDDDVTFISGANTWTSGIISPLDTRKGSSEAMLVEQGRLFSNDKKMYLLGEINTSGAAVKIGIGSPPDEEYYIVPEGVTAWELGGTKAYKKLYLRVLTNGSFVGE